ncbi:MAG TPA: DUF4404 family protein [Ignavibacteria bacterium]
MKQNTIEKIEEKIRVYNSLKEEDRAELLKLLETLKTEIIEFSEKQGENADSLEGFISASAHEATREQKNPTLLKLAIEGLSASVEGFEESHPKLVENVNNIASMLSNMGI